MYWKPIGVKDEDKLSCGVELHQRHPKRQDGDGHPKTDCTGKK